MAPGGLGEEVLDLGRFVVADGGVERLVGAREMGFHPLDLGEQPGAGGGAVAHPGLAADVLAIGLEEEAVADGDGVIVFAEATSSAGPAVLPFRPALLEWAASLKLFAYSCAGLALFFPWGIAEAHAPLELVFALPALILKLAVGGIALAVLETLSAKMRIFRVPEFLATAFLMAVIGLLVHILLGT